MHTESFESQIDRHGPMLSPYLGPCWVWAGGVSNKGYGEHGGQFVHRIAFELWVGPIPDGLQIDHLCRTRRCVNPAHLEAVTRRENILRGDGTGAKYARRTHCKHGHPYDEANTRYRGNTRICQTCCRLYRRENERRRRLLRLSEPPKPPPNRFRDGRTEETAQEVRARYEGGEATTALAREVGVKAPTINGWVRRAGGRVRSSSEANVLRFERERQ